MMKKQFYTLATLLLMSLAVKAQVGIGTAIPNSSSMLDVTSTTKGFLMPRMTTSERIAIIAPAAGLQVYDSTTNTTWYFNGTIWVNTSASTASVNIYNSDGTLIGNRAVSMGASTLTFNGTGTGVGIRVNTAIGSTSFSQSSTGRFDIDAPSIAGGRFTMLESGNLGINWNTPTTKLELRGLGQAFPATSGTTQSVGQYARFHDSSNLVLDMGGNSAGGNWLQSTDIGNLGASYPLMLNPNGGNVGVGLTSPTQKLDVNGAAVLRGGGDATSIAGTQLLLGYAGQSNYQHAIKTRHDANASATTGNAIDFYIWTPVDAASAQPSKNVMTINGVGNVGIGTTTPSTKLEVNGVITATKIQGPSDQRFKKNIKPIENALGKIMKLGGYTYDWRDASEFPKQTLGKGHDMGVIAQEVEKQFPEAVTTNTDGYKAVSYTELVPPLIEAIKSLRAIIETQQVKIDTLTNEVAKLKKITPFK